MTENASHSQSDMLPIILEQATPKNVLFTWTYFTAIYNTFLHGKGFVIAIFFRNTIVNKVLTFTTSCSTDEVSLNHEIYLELYICFSCQNHLFISSQRFNPVVAQRLYKINSLMRQKIIKSKLFKRMEFSLFITTLKNLNN